jgi:hypothetical protein
LKSRLDQEVADLEGVFWWMDCIIFAFL